MQFPLKIYENRRDTKGNLIAWDTNSVHDILLKEAGETVGRTTERALTNSSLIPSTVKLGDLRDEFARAPKEAVVFRFEAEAKRKRQLSLIVQLHHSQDAGKVLFSNDSRMGRRWVFLDDLASFDKWKEAFQALAGSRDLLIWPHGEISAYIRKFAHSNGGHEIRFSSGKKLCLGTFAYYSDVSVPRKSEERKMKIDSVELSHLDRLEADSIHIMREVMAQAENPVMMYSIGKDSAVMLHIAQKAFYPSPPPFPLLHVDTRWKFQSMYQFRDQVAAESGMDLIVHINPEGVEKNINPFDHGSSLHTDVMKTQGLKQALDKYGFDVAFGGARRDEEKSRAKERVFSFRSESHNWDPKNQRPELWNLYNGHKTKGESIRVFPLIELDRARYLGVHLQGADTNSAVIFCR